MMNILITGTSRGIGLGLTNQFLQRTNAKVVATCRNPEDASELQELSQRYRDRLVILPLDITRPDSFIQLHRTLPDFGVHSIDILIGNAAISNRDHPNDPILSCNPEEVMQIFRTNVVGNLILLQTFHSMVAQSTLKIAAIISSSQGSIEHAVSSGQSDPTGYRLSKVALNMMSVLYAVQPQVRDAGVKVLIIHPGWVKTDMGMVNDQPAKTDIETSTAGILELIQKTALFQLKQVSSYLEHNMNPFQFSTPFEEIDKKENLQEFIEKLKTDNFVYVKFDGEILPW